MTKKIFRIYDNNQISILNEYSAIYKKTFDGGNQRAIVHLESMRCHPYMQQT